MGSGIFVNRFSAAIASVSAVSLSAILASSAQAQTVLSGYTTGGDDMDGMRITVEFLDGTIEEAIWGTTGTNQGGAFGTGWGLTFSGSTTYSQITPDHSITNPWQFSATSAVGIAALTIDAFAGNAMFDIYAFYDTEGNALPQTVGSADGWGFDVHSGDGPDSYEYFNPIDISQGDLFGSLTMSWEEGFSGLLEFLADTDSGTASNPATIAATTAADTGAADGADIPEPSTTLALLGAVALGAKAVRQRKTTAIA